MATNDRPNIPADHGSEGDAILDDAPVPPAPSLLAGRFRVERTLGEGAFGRVYLAFDTRLASFVAIKELLASPHSPSAYRYHEQRQRFQREARAARLSQHPNIVTVHDLVLDEAGTYYLVMEYVDGESLEDLLARTGALPVEQAIAIVTDLAKGLAVVHAQEIVHRDLKPANIMVSKRGEAKLMDFGMAQVGEESQRTGWMVASGHPGTPRYMSPEQRGGVGYLDGRSDLYALGMILYEMLAGEAYAVLRGQALGKVSPGVPAAVVGVVEKLTAPEADDRYTDAEEVVRALTAAIAGGEAPAGTIPTEGEVDGGASRQRTGSPGRGAVRNLRWWGRTAGRRVMLVGALLAVVLAMVSPLAWAHGGWRGVMDTGAVPTAPPDTYTVADNKNLIAYSYPKEWRPGGNASPDVVDTVAGYTAWNPYTRISVAQEEINPATTLDAYTDAFIARLLKLNLNAKPGPISKQSAQLAGQDARIVDLIYPNTGDRLLSPTDDNLYGYRILTLHDNRAWLLEYTTALANKDALQPQFDLFASTVTFCPASGCRQVQTVPTVVPGQTTDWASSEFGIQLRYPVDWPAANLPDRSSLLLDLFGPEGVEFSVYVMAIYGTPAEELGNFRAELLQSTQYTYTPGTITDASVGSEKGKTLTVSYVKKSDPGAKSRSVAHWIVNYGGHAFLLCGDVVGAHRTELEATIQSVRFATPTASSPSVAVALGGYVADFATWSSGDTSYVGNRAGTQRTTFDPQSRELRMAITSGGGGFTRYPPEPLAFEDVRIEMDAYATIPGSVYGVAILVQPRGQYDITNARYEFSVNPDGRFRLRMIRSDNTVMSIVAPTASPAIKTGDAMNHLAVTIKGDHVTCSINGTEVFAFTSILKAPGRIAISVASSGSMAEVVFKDLRAIPA